MQTLFYGQYSLLRIGSGAAAYCILFDIDYF